VGTEKFKNSLKPVLFAALSRFLQAESDHKPHLVRGVQQGFACSISLLSAAVPEARQAQGGLEALSNDMQVVQFMFLRMLTGRVGMSTCRQLLLREFVASR
jgi:hypothetical protein